MTDYMVSIQLGYKGKKQELQLEYSGTGSKEELIEIIKSDTTWTPQDTDITSGKVTVNSGGYITGINFGVEGNDNWVNIVDIYSEYYDITDSDYLGSIDMYQELSYPYIEVVTVS